MARVVEDVSVFVGVFVKGTAFFWCIGKANRVGKGAKHGFEQPQRTNKRKYINKDDVRSRLLSFFFFVPFFPHSSYL